MDGLPPVTVVVEGRRQDVGLLLRLEGRVRGTLEWYLEPLEDGTMVNSILDLEVPGRLRRAGRGMHRARSSVRRGMVALKELLE
jgi:hypothetical protein